MKGVTVFRRDDVPVGSVYGVLHEATATRIGDGAQETLPTGIYANEFDPRTDDELRDLIADIETRRANGEHV